MPFSLSSNRVARYTGSKTSTTPRTTPVMIAPVQAFHTRMGSEVDVEAASVWDGCDGAGGGDAGGGGGGGDDNDGGNDDDRGDDGVCGDGVDADSGSDCLVDVGEGSFALVDVAGDWDWVVLDGVALSVDDLIKGSGAKLADTASETKENSMRTDDIV
eukprot:1303629-Amorphochlora_amoeboformis.AAC.1